MSPLFDWHFPTTDGGIEDGLNDSVRQNFEGNHEYFVARESIQNSLDARESDGEPVTVVFERIDAPKSSIPGLKQLEAIFGAAKEYSEGQGRSEKYFNDVAQALSKQTVSVLKISDYNTSGLNGDDNSTHGEWYKLLRAEGVNSMNGVGGGSFGIGKGAPFAASLLRTVFYSTVNRNGEYKFQGIARLASFKNEQGDVRRGMGQFGIKDDSNRVSSIKDQDNLPDFLKRDTQGTDVYALGYRTLESDWTNLLLNSVLNNFWDAIHFGDLRVVLKENGNQLHYVHSENLGQYMSEFAAGTEDSYEFYRAVIEPSTPVIKGKLGILGDCELYIRTGEGLTKDVQLMRRSKMAICKIRRFRVLPEPYVAVFMCTSKEGNELLREMEPPAHDKWEIERGNNELGNQMGKKITDEYQDWIKEGLKSLAEVVEDDDDNILDLGKWLPDIEERDDLKSFSGTFGERTGEATHDETAVEIGSKTDPEDLNHQKATKQEINLTKEFERGDGDPPVGTKKVKNKTHTARVGDKPGKVPRINTAAIDLMAREIFVNGVRKHKIVLTSAIDQDGSIKLLTVGDDGDFPADIKEAFTAEGTKVETNGAVIKNINLQAQVPYVIILTLGNQKRYSLGVE